MSEIRRDAAEWLHTVREFREILMLPLRVQADETLGKKRRSIQDSPADGLAEFAKWVEGSGKWKRIPDYLADAGDLGYSEALRRAPEEKKREMAEANERLRAQEFLYFHPFIQKFLYPRPNAKDAAIQVLKREDIRRAVVQTAEGRVVEFSVERVVMYLFPTDVAIIAIELRLDGAVELSEAMRLLDQVRRLHAPFWSVEEDGRVTPQLVPRSVRWLDELGKVVGRDDFGDWSADVKTIQEKRRGPIAAHWEELLLPLRPLTALGTEPTLLFEQIEDERIPVQLFLSVDNARDVSDGDFARLLFCDGPGDSRGYAYGRTFMEGVVKSHAYDRFWEPREGWTTRYLFSGYSFVTLGQSGDPFYETHIRNHFRYHYFHLGLIAHLQKASLLVYWRRLAELVHEYNQQPPGAAVRKKFHDDAKWLMEDLADFVSRFWFSEVSNQLQPTEMFRKWVEKMGTERLYSEVMEQAKLVREVRSGIWQETATKFANRFVPVFLATAILGVSTGIDKIFEKGFQGWPTIGAFLVIVVVPLVVASAVCWSAIRLIERGSGSKRDG